MGTSETVILRVLRADMAESVKQYVSVGPRECHHVKGCVGGEGECMIPSVYMIFIFLCDGSHRFTYIYFTIKRQEVKYGNSECRMSYVRVYDCSVCDSPHLFIESCFIQ